VKRRRKQCVQSPEAVKIVGSDLSVDHTLKSRIRDLKKKKKWDLWGGGVENQDIKRKTDELLNSGQGGSVLSAGSSFGGRVYQER